MKPFENVQRPPCLIAEECTILREMLAEAWVRVRKLKKNKKEDYHAWLVVIIKLENELNIKSCMVN